MRAPAWRVYSIGWTAFRGSMHVPGYLGKEADSSRLLCLPVNSDLSLVEEKLPHTLHSSTAWGLLTWTSEIPSALGLVFLKTNGNCDVGILKKSREQINKRQWKRCRVGISCHLSYIWTFHFQDVFEIVTVLLKPCPTGLTLYDRNKYFMVQHELTVRYLRDSLLFVREDGMHGMWMQL